MKKNPCKILCLLLSLLMLLSLLPVTALAAEQLDKITTEELPEVCKSDFADLNMGILSQKPTGLVHTVLGDSIAAGFALPDYLEKCDFDNNIYFVDGQPIAGSYGQLVSDALGAEALFHAHCAWRTTEFLNVVRDGTVGTGMDATLATGFFQTPDEVLYEHEATPAAIAKSNFITLNLGANDMFTYGLVKVISKVVANGGLDSLDLPELDLSKISSFEELLANFCKVLPLVKDVADIVNELYAGCEEGLASFKKNFPQVLDYIAEQNPSAETFVLSVDNPAKFTINIGDNLSFDLYTIFSSYATRAQIFQQEVCAQRANVTYVDVTGASYHGLASLDIASLDLNNIPLTAVKVLQPVHPTPEGHQYIAKQLTSVIQSKLKHPATPNITKNSLKQPVITWDKVDGAVSYRVYRSTDITKGYKLVLATPLTGCVDLIASSGTNYYYRVVAVMDLLGRSRSGASEAVQLVNFTAQDLSNAKIAAAAKLDKVAGAKQSKMVQSIVSGGKSKIDAATTVDGVNLASASAIAAVETQLHLEKPVTSVVKDVVVVTKGVTKTVLGAVGGLAKALFAW